MFETSKTSSSAAQELIAFRLSGQEFCVGVMSIREIRGWTPATPLPASPHFMRGVINLRGTVLPIIDLAARLGFPMSDPTARHAIIVAQIGDQVVGLLVEGVSDIFTVTDDQIQPTPDVASELAKRFVRGVIPMEGRLISLLAIDKLLPEMQREAA
jgi:purine-binding chemotaxis protein CheW